MISTPVPPPKEAARIAGMFDAIASRYDLLNHLLSAGLDRRWRARAVAALRLAGTETVLDVCTGTGDLALAARQGPARAAQVVGIDFSQAMLRIASGKARRAGLESSVRIVRGDAARLPLLDQSVDAVTVAFGVRNIEDPARACAEMHRVLRPGGRLVVLEFSLPRSSGIRAVYAWYFRRVLPLVGRLVSGHASAYTYLPESVGTFAAPEQFAGMLRAAGFGEVEIVPMSFGIVQMFAAVRSTPSARAGRLDPATGPGSRVL